MIYCMVVNVPMALNNIRCSFGNVYVLYQRKKIIVTIEFEIQILRG